MPDGLGIRERVENLSDAPGLHLGTERVCKHHAVINGDNVVGAARAEPHEEHLVPCVKERA